jgi:hypothetical protein
MQVQELPHPAAHVYHRDRVSQRGLDDPASDGAFHHQPFSPGPRRGDPSRRRRLRARALGEEARGLLRDALHIDKGAQNGEEVGTHQSEVRSCVEVVDGVTNGHKRKSCLRMQYVRPCVINTNPSRCDYSAVKRVL